MRIVGFTAAILLASCSKPNPVVCCTSPSDCNSLGVTDSSRPCSDGFVCIDHECDSAPPADAAPACTIDADCPASSPHCAPTNLCVQCESSTQCGSSLPICDSMSNACRGCEDDSECPSKVCDVTTGLCADGANVLYSAPTGSDAAACTATDPCSITHAVASSDSTRSTIKLGTGTYSADVLLGSKALTIHAQGATVMPVQAASTITIGNGAHIRIVGGSIVSGTSAAINCGSGDPSASPISTLDLDTVDINSQEFEIIAYPCILTARNSHFKGVGYPGIFVASPSKATIDRCVFEGRGIEALGSSAVVRVTNSLFANQISNGEPSDPGPIGGNQFGTDAPGSAYVSFSTFVNTNILCGNITPACAGGNGNGVCVDNSIITSASGDAIRGAGCRVSYSIAMPQATALIGTNNLVNVDPLFAGGSSYLLKSSSPAVDAADPSAVDSIDLAGTSRPQGARNDIGAYEYKP